jgi:hypothetical protein
MNTERKSEQKRQAGYYKTFRHGYWNICYYNDVVQEFHMPCFEKPFKESDFAEIGDMVNPEPDGKIYSIDLDKLESLPNMTPEAFIDACKAQGNIIWNSEPDDGWIKVSDRLPETSEGVLVANKNGVSHTTHSFHVGQKTWNALTGNWCLDPITHWRPLPNPPKSEI